MGPKTLRVRVVDAYGQSAERTLQLSRLGDAADGGTAPDAGTSPGPDAGSPGTAGGTPGTEGGTAEPAPAPTLVVETPADGTVARLPYGVGDLVEEGALLVAFEGEGDAAA